MARGIDPNDLALMEAEEAKYLAARGIVFEQDGWYVKREAGAYSVYRPMGTHAESVASFGRNEDGKSLAIAYAKSRAGMR